MGACCCKSSAKKQGLQTPGNAATGGSFPVVVINPVSTAAISSPSTCSTVSTTSSDSGDDGSCDEDESKADDQGMTPNVARSVLARMAFGWKKRNIENSGASGSPTQSANEHASTPRPVIRPPSVSTGEGSDSDPWDVVTGEL